MVRARRLKTLWLMLIAAYGSPRAADAAYRLLTDRAADRAFGDIG